MARRLNSIEALVGFLDDKDRKQLSEVMSRIFERIEFSRSTAAANQQDELERERLKVALKARDFALDLWKGAQLY